MIKKLREEMRKQAQKEKGVRSDSSVIGHKKRVVL